MVKNEALETVFLRGLLRSASCDTFSFGDLSSSSGLPCMHFFSHVLVQFNTVIRIPIMKP